MADALAQPSLLLVAREQVDDPRFAKTVLLVTRHGARGTIGIILNRPLDTSIDKLFPGLPRDKGPARPLFFGGPLGQEQLIFAFGERSTSEHHTLEVHPGIYLGHAPRLLQQLLRRAPPIAQLRIFVGHAGWAPNQLEREIARGDWYLMPVDPKIVFAEAPLKMWSELHRKASERRADNTRWRLTAAY